MIRLPLVEPGDARVTEDEDLPWSVEPIEGGAEHGEGGEE
jgi:hypothetical protein